MFTDEEILERILNLLEESKKEQKDLCKTLNVTKSTFSNWKKGLNKSYKKYLYQIADYFDVSVDYLLGKTDEKKPSANADGLVSIEHLLALGLNEEKLNSLSDSDFDVIKATLNALIENLNKNK